MKVETMGDGIGVFVAGLQLADADDSTIAELRRLLLEHSVLCVRDQRLTPEAFRDAMVRFGTPMLPTDGSVHPDVPELNVISHEDRAKTGRVPGFHWHTDQSYRDRPAAFTMLYGVEVPEIGGNTEFVDMYAAYEALPERMKAELADVRVVHRFRSTRSDTFTRYSEQEEDLPEVLHPIVRTHAESGRKALYLNRNRMDRFPHLDHAESEALLDELMAHATQERFIYRHKWRPGDVLVWDNRCTMHKANGDYPQGARRYVVRMMTEGERPL